MAHELADSSSEDLKAEEYDPDLAGVEGLGKGHVPGAQSMSTALLAWSCRMHQCPANVIVRCTTWILCLHLCLCKASASQTISDCRHGSSLPPW